MNEDVKISVVIPTYNRVKLLRRALYSLDNQTFPRDGFEVIVVDDGSEDGTRSFLQGALFHFTLKRVCNSGNLGTATARNRGVAEGKGEIIVFLDDDMEVVPEFLEAHWEAHERFDPVAVIGNVQTSPRIAKTPFLEYLETRGVHKVRPGQPVPFRYFLSNNASVPRQVLLQVGGFDGKIRGYGGEDMELAYRMSRLAKLHFVYKPEAVSFHRAQRDLDQTAKLLYEYGREGLHYIVTKHPELKRVLHLNVLEPLRFGRDGPWQCLQKLAARLVFFPLFHRWAWVAYRYGKFRGLVFPAISYILAYSVVKGYRTREGGALR